MSGPAPQPSRMRGRLPLALAAAALAIAFVGAFAPAREVRATYSWPPEELPSGEPSRTWYAPLLLARQQAQSIVATIPCLVPDALSANGSETTILATARTPQTNGGLGITRVGNELVVRVGSEEVVRAPLLPTGEALSDGCAYQLRIDGASWSIEGGPDKIPHDGDLNTSATVTGLFSEVDLRSPNAPSITVTTLPHRVQTTPLQTISRVLSALLAVVALILVATRDRQRQETRLGRSLRRGIAALGLADAVVGLLLLGWWVLSPTFPDDGWVFIRQSNFASSGGFTNYYNGYGANLPNGYWLEWTQHWLVEATSSLVFLRIPSLILLAAIWILCRWTLAQVLGPDRPGRAVVWSLAAAFVVQAFAWGMTIRPEPATAFLATVVLAAMVQFIRTGASAPVALSALALPFAVTGHHAGVVALAPLVVGIVPLTTWARSRPALAISAAMSSVALFLTLLLAGTDLRQWGADVETSRTTGSSGENWLDELNRYGRLSNDLYGTPLRRASVVLMGLAVLAYLLRRRRSEGRLPDFPGACLAVALGLLVLTPSKWPWHFGALIGLATVAVAAESARLRREARDARRWDAWPFVAVFATCVAAEWAWHIQQRWNTLDLRSPPWFSAFAAGSSVAKMSVLVPVLLLLVAGVWQLGRRPGRPEAFPWRFASWLPAAFALPLVVFTVAALVWDVASTSAWTLTRQNLSALAGRHECGLADDLLTPVRDDRETLVMTDVVTYLPCAHLPRLAHGVVPPPDHLVTSDIWDEIGYSTSPFNGIYDLYGLRRVPLARSAKPTTSVQLYRVARPLPGGELAPPDVTDD